MGFYGFLSFLGEVNLFPRSADGYDRPCFSTYGSRVLEAYISHVLPWPFGKEGCLLRWLNIDFSAQVSQNVSGLRWEGNASSFHRLGEKNVGPCSRLPGPMLLVSDAVVGSPVLQPVLPRLGSPCSFMKNFLAHSVSSVCLSVCLLAIGYWELEARHKPLARM